MEPLKRFSVKLLQEFPIELEHFLMGLQREFAVVLVQKFEVEDAITARVSVRTPEIPGEILDKILVELFEKFRIGTSTKIPDETVRDTLYGNPSGTPRGIVGVVSLRNSLLDFLSGRIFCGTTRTF